MADKRRTVWITGASSGMGAEFVRTIESFGVRLDEIWAIARRQERLEALQAPCPVRPLALDLTDPASFSEYQALLEPSDRYLPLVLDDIARQWGAMAFSGATSVWETALGAEDFHRAGSLCHGWSAVPIFAYCRAWSYRN